MAICETCDYANRPPYKSPCSECDKTMGSPFCCYEHEEKPTNADHIRAMSDDELAKTLEDKCICPPTSECAKVCGDCHACLIEWLQRPAE